MEINIEAIPNIPRINKGDNIGEIIVMAALKSNIKIKNGDILCVASKVISTAEGQDIALNNVKPTALANQIHQKIPRKDPRTIQKMIDETGDPFGGKLDIDTDNSYIGAWLPNGMRLTSAGIDKIDSEHVMLLPRNPDWSAKKISTIVQKKLNAKVGVIITDSDGRIEKLGATQIAIGLYGVPALRISESIDPVTGKVKKSAETFCDLIAATAALIMGQRGTNKPIVKISGVEYTFNEKSQIIDSLCKVPKEYLNGSVADYSK
ncbi:coenzyme F420-0:L-glutamate ligase [Bacillus thuringiensis]|uniref:coenzyme F420-0:L-glutamate ligase n=1 Tax=Bacillus thuringiensis TaxID=1428 RepID=UPI000E4E7820|nr:coenzyme F420-0:L-glutamate ligase [Bacillus thuringiensis]MDZ3952322.1 coenzyme F420-0:L-glutamate ligase [Bacillus thuringiensis]RGP43732.1 glutamate ligase [Bacillus thuringiensis]